MAVYILEKEQPFPDVMAANRKDIFEAWRRYKTVAHSCGAFSNLYVHALRVLLWRKMTMSAPLSFAIISFCRHAGVP